MDLQEIQNKINSLFSDVERKIVFWYDTDGAYAEEVDGITLRGDVKLQKLTGKNTFATKLLLERQDPKGSYLIYAPFSKPDDKQDSLADTYYYAEHFHSDKLVQLMGDMDIPRNCQEEVSKYRKFWTAGNVEKFTNLQIEVFTPESIDLAILCVLAGVKTLNQDELVRKVVLSGVKDNPILKKFDSYKIEDVFWKLCEKTYGYIDSTPTIEQLLCTMMVTYMDTTTSGMIPNEWKSFLSQKPNDCVIFVKNLMSSDASREFYDDFADKVSRELNAEKLIRQIPINQILECDVLEDYDRNIISWIISKIEDDMLDEKIAGLSIAEICDVRCKAAYHFAPKYRKQYRMLYHAYRLMKDIELHEYQPTLKEVVEDYVKNTWQIDFHYRKFYFYMDSVGMSEEIEKIRDMVENIYTNKYLGDFSYKWNQTLTDEVYRTYPDLRQQDFFNRQVYPFMHDKGREGKVVVIISDGMRYECGRELLSKLDLDEKCDAEMKYMISVLPSETTLGMASLLPHKTMSVDMNMNVTVDGLPCSNSLSDRQKILQKHYPNSACYKFDHVKSAKRDEVREMFQDKDIIYIYQDQIDARGEKQPTENEVFNACEEAIEEIQQLIRRLTGYVSTTRYIVTADHGFIYKRDKLVESEKISMDKSKVSFVNKRYLLSEEEIAKEGLVNRALIYIDGFTKGYVATPMGVDIIKSPGGGQNYVHGGSSLQEMIVPVIKVTTMKGKQETDMVDVELSNFSHKVTAIEFRLEFMQMEPVTDKKKPRRMVAFFVNDKGQKISYDVPITANNTDKDAKNRLITEKFTLKSGDYRRDRDYFLVLADMEDERVEFHRYKFTIDIAKL